jgi:hypothetical protein
MQEKKEEKSEGERLLIRTKRCVTFVEKHSLRMMQLAFVRGPDDAE